MWLQHLKAFLITIFLLGVGIGLLSFGWTQVQTDQRLEKSTATVEGRVISSSTKRGSRGGQYSALVVEYKPVDSPAIRKEFDVGSSDYHAAKETGKARVTYLPEDPQVSRVTHFAVMPFWVLSVLGGVMILAGLFCLVHALMTRVKA
jgi:uncharacterized membrane protein YphA (DoxX/SURF4 family)